MEFSISSRMSGDRTIVAVTGELDSHSAPALQAELDPITAVHGASLVIDLTEVDFIDSSALGVLVATLKHVREVNGRLDVVVSKPRVLKVFKLTGLDAVIPLHATLDEAVAGG
ncbi:MAG: STAS domain-containing protein [Actinomycetes bacterium]